MNTLKKTERIFKWIIFGIALAHLISYFMPIYGVARKSGSAHSDPKTTLFYLYGENVSLYLAILLTILFVALVFLFASFKNSKLFFCGFSASYIINCIFATIVSSRALSRSMENITSSYYEPSYEYSFYYGYYIFIVTMILLALAIIGAFVIYLILQHKELESEAEQKEQAHQDLKIDILRKRIELLDDLKNQGILTESECGEKRAEIIKELKV
jgi:uncharacterized membrane protein